MKTKGFHSVCKRPEKVSFQTIFLLVFLPFWLSFLYYQIGHDRSKIDNGSCPLVKTFPPKVFGILVTYKEQMQDEESP